MNGKSQRIPNFTSSEKEILMEIILSKHANFLEDKKTNKASIEKKQEVWTEIEAEFNNKAPIVAYRKQDQLKRLYENKKKELRKKMAAYKNQQYKTGGGPPPEEPKLDKAEEILIKIINEKSVCGLPPAFDSDALDGEPLAKIPRKDNEKIDNTEYLEQDLESTDDIQEFEFVPEDFETVCQNNNIDVHDFAKKQIQRCPLSGLEGPINAKLRAQPVGSRSFVQGYREIASCAVAGSSNISELNNISNDKTKTPSITESSTRNKTSSLVTPSKTLSSDRRRPMSGIRALTSSDVAEKYNLLLDKRLFLVEKQIEQCVEFKTFTKEGQNHKIKLLKQQDENLSLDKEEKILKIELLKAELKYKKSLFSSNI